MGFFNKNALPPELRDLPAEEIAKRLDKAKADSAELTKLQEDAKNTGTRLTELETQATAGRDAVERLKKLREAGLVDDEGNPITRSSESTTTTTTTTPSLADWLSDPQKAFSQAAQPLTQATLLSGALTAKLAASEFLSKQDAVNRRLWKKYEDEVTKLVAALPAEQQIFPQTWINQFTFVKGIHLGDVVKEAQGQGDAFFSEGVTSSGNGIDNNRSAEETLTPEEEKVAKAMKMKPEDWIKRRKALKIRPNA